MGGRAGLPDLFAPRTHTLQQLQAELKVSFEEVSSFKKKKIEMLSFRGEPVSPPAAGLPSALHPGSHGPGLDSLQEVEGAQTLPFLVSPSWGYPAHPDPLYVAPTPSSLESGLPGGCPAPVRTQSCVTLGRLFNLSEW